MKGNFDDWIVALVILVMLWFLGFGTILLFGLQQYIPAVVITLSIFSLLLIFGLVSRLGFEGKNLWDWLKLLVIPLVLAVGAIGFGWQQNQANLRFSQQQATATTKQLNADATKTESQRQENLIQAYLDSMSALMNNTHLRDDTQPGKDLRNLARGRTLTILSALDPGYKPIILRFLYYSALIYRDPSPPVVNLNGADLRGIDLSKFGTFDLRSADLAFANLSGANLSNVRLDSAFLAGAILNNATLNGANLTDAQLYNYNYNTSSTQPVEVADLSGAHLDNATLIGADLIQVNLSNATLIGADLSNANLLGADLSNANLSNAKLHGIRQIKDPNNPTEANLGGPKLIKANLTGADLTGADLSNANLFGAIVTNDQLATAKSTNCAIIPNGTKNPC